MAWDERRESCVLFLGTWQMFATIHPVKRLKKMRYFVLMLLGVLIPRSLLGSAIPQMGHDLQIFLWMEKPEQKKEFEN